MGRIVESWKARESLWIGLIVFLLGIIVRVIIVATVPEEGFSGYAEYQVANIFNHVGDALVFLGAVWVGVYLARWGVRKAKG